MQSSVRIWNSRTGTRAIFCSMTLKNYRSNASVSLSRSTIPIIVLLMEANALARTEMYSMVSNTRKEIVENLLISMMLVQTQWLLSLQTKQTMLHVIHLVSEELTQFQTWIKSAIVMIIRQLVKTLQTKQSNTGEVLQKRRLLEKLKPRLRPKQRQLKLLKMLNMKDSNKNSRRQKRERRLKRKDLRKNTRQRRKLLKKRSKL